MRAGLSLRWAGEDTYSHAYSTHLFVAAEGGYPCVSMVLQDCSFVNQAMLGEAGEIKQLRVDQLGLTVQNQI